MNAPGGLTRRGFLAASGLTFAGLAAGGAFAAKRSPLVVYDCAY